VNRDELAALRDALSTVLAWPEAVRAEVARWIAPEASRSSDRPNGLDHGPHPLVAPASPRAAPVPSSAKASRPQPRRGKRAPPRAAEARAAEAQLVAALRQSSGMTERALAEAAGASRATIGDRLRRLSERGEIERDAAGKWRVKGEAARPAAQGEAARPTSPPLS
jgi:hypothetical protein